MRFLLSLLTSNLFLTNLVYATPHYVDAAQYDWTHQLIRDGNKFDYLKTVQRLGDEFDFVCMDTFCEGDYGNLRSFGITCSITLESGNVGKCVWTFIGSYDDINENSGDITPEYYTETCDLGFEGNAQQLASFLSKTDFRGKDAYETKIPGSSGKTLWDVLTSCIASS